MTVPPDILLVVAIVLIVMASAAAISAWADRRRPYVAVLTLAIGLAMVAMVHLRDSDGLSWRDLPMAFVHVAARILN